MAAVGKVLVCDDDVVNLDVVRELLQDDYEVALVESGEACLAKLVEFQPDVLLLDIMMPGIGGHETCRRIKVDACSEHPQVILVSARTSTQDRLKGYEAGADDFLAKPFDHDELLAKVRVHSRLRTAHKRLAERTAELSRAKCAAEAANRAKSSFLANMSHEIRTPMTAILGFAENLLAPDLSESQKLNAVQTINQNGKHLLQIINDILNISKIEAGEMRMEKIWCSPCEIISHALSLIRPQGAAKGLSISIEYSGAIPETILTDPTRLRQILINLLSNAVKFTESGSVQLLIKLVEEEGQRHSMQFDVVDTGIGMTEEQAALVFEPFNQGDTSATRRFGGTGLGMTISKLFVAKLGGDISIVRAELGVGSHVRLTIDPGPMNNVSMLESPAVAIHVASRTTGPGTALEGALDFRILLAEDGVDNQRLISFILTRAGADVTVVDNGRKAVDKVLEATIARRPTDDAQPFDAVLMDMQMPVMDGYAATKELRENGYRGLIIALTAHAMEEDRKKCLDSGCDEFVTKPIDRRKLIDLIASQITERCAAPVHA